MVGALLDWVVPVLGGIVGISLAHLLGAGWPLALVMMLIGMVAFQFITIYLFIIIKKYLLHSRKKH
jgi:positive regulator of sigma E activity